MSDLPACRCELFEHPHVVFNSPGRDALLYRAGDYVTFRHALLLSRPKELELSSWRPGAKGDLAVQMVEWWAYLADVLTFYNERIANEDYLRTADLPESVTRLIKLLGYRPRPAIGARGTVAALLSGPKNVPFAPVFAVQSKPGPGKQPQVFELDAPVELRHPDAVAADPAPNPALFAADGSILLKGAVALAPGTPLLIVEKGWHATNEHYAVVSVTSAQPEKDPRGKPNTRVHLSGKTSAIPPGAKADDYDVVRSAQSAHLWQFKAALGLVISGDAVHLDSLTRDIAAGQFVLFEARLSQGAKGKGKNKKGAKTAATTQTLVNVKQYAEQVWIANPKDDNPEVPPALPAVPVAIPHAVLHVDPALPGILDLARGSIAAHHDWRSAGQPIASPAAEFDGVATTLLASGPALFPEGFARPVQIEDADGNGVQALASVSGNRSALTLSSLPVPPVRLKAPLRVLFDLLPLSRGKTVVREVLGSGDATRENQEFVLAKSPLTYLLAPGAAGSFKSTLRVWVDGLEWNEAESFYAQPPRARIFVTAEDESEKTHVKFGDGVNGARLPSGVDNVVASYRHGAGKEAPDAGSLTVILQPRPGLKSIRNPVRAGGGDDPDPATKVRRYAPQSVLTFGRAVSGDDYQSIAAQTPGVARARAYWGWDSGEQRTVVTVYVGDDASAREAAKIALAGAADPNRPLLVNLAKVIPIALTLKVEVEAGRDPDGVASAVTAALTDTDRGLLGLNRVRIGEPLYESQIYRACLDVAGTVAVHALQFSAKRGSGGFQAESAFRYDPGQEGFFQLAAADLHLTAEVSGA